MDAAATESGRLADRVHTGDRTAVAAQHPALEVGLQAAQGLAGQHVQPDRDQRSAGAGRPSPALASSISCGATTRISRSR